ncbi:hypothetical protein RBU60_02815 [Mesonia sp. MT50]|uniref:Uncharacterized protein n=1 Tax=Mesonia profundi TaxID=3070998 RepID=A0ABU0ZYF8_9FLAO|nr:hypothetical protein [Mesonia profundi]MDQ7916493.1 hypothetical protein [Mesonia profundi]
MKKIIFMALATGLFAFTSCSSDDDGEEVGEPSASACQTCTLTAEDGETSAIEYCDNGDGTVTATVVGTGSETTIPLDGTSFSVFISTMEQITSSNCQ